MLYLNRNINVQISIVVDTLIQFHLSSAVIKQNWLLSW